MRHGTARLAGKCTPARLAGKCTPARLAGNSTTIRVAGHFGELLQGKLGPSGPIALVTLPCPALAVTAFRRPDGPFLLHARRWCPAPRARIAALLRALTGGAPRGRLILAADMPPGGGAGASTAALVAAARTLADLAPEPLARLCLALEGATDPLMFAEPARLLWASREARTLATLPPLPPLEAVGGFLGPHRGTDPADTRFADVADIAATWAPAAARHDLAALAALASASARRNATARGFPPPDDLAALAARHGALGFAVAHTGSARALLFAPGTGDPAAALAALRAAGHAHVLRFRV